MSKKDTVQLVLTDQDRRTHDVVIPLRDPLFEPAEHVPDPARDGYRDRVRSIVMPDLIGSNYPAPRAQGVREPT